MNEMVFLGDTVISLQTLQLQLLGRGVFLTTQNSKCKVPSSGQISILDYSILDYAIIGYSWQNEPKIREGYLNSGNLTCSCIADSLSYSVETNNDFLEPKAPDRINAFEMSKSLVSYHLLIWVLEQKVTASLQKIIGRKLNLAMWMAFC